VSSPSKFLRNVCCRNTVVRSAGLTACVLFAVWWRLHIFALAPSCVHTCHCWWDVLCLWTSEQRWVLPWHVGTAVTLETVTSTRLPLLSSSNLGGATGGPELYRYYIQFLQTNSGEVSWNTSQPPFFHLIQRCVTCVGGTEPAVERLFIRNDLHFPWQPEIEPCSQELICRTTYIRKACVAAINLNHVQLSVI
jgi:hypothetical protein